MQIERDAWILLAARYPGQAPNWARVKFAALADRELQQLYLAYCETSDWDPAYPGWKRSPMPLWTLPNATALTWNATRWT